MTKIGLETHERMKKLSTTALTLVNPSPTLGLHVRSDQVTSFEQQSKQRRHTVGTSPSVSVDTKHREKRHRTISELNVVGQYKTSEQAFNGRKEVWIICLLD